MGGAMLSKSSIQFSIDGRGCVPSLLFDLRPNCGPMPPPETRTLTGKPDSVSWDTAPFSWLLCVQGFVCALQESVSLILCKFYNQIPLASIVKFPRGSPSLCRIPSLGSLLWVLELSEQFKNFCGIIFLQFVCR